MELQRLKDFLDQKVAFFNKAEFITNDPISIPKKFSLLQDIEIIALWTAVLSWGQRATIIRSGNKLVELMDGSPYEFVKYHKEKDRKRFESFVHRTFQPLDALYFLDFFQRYYQDNDSLEDAFISNGPEPIKNGLVKFKQLFFDSDNAPKRTQKHISSPEGNSSCKRLNMFLRWMVRDDSIVDFGCWKRISPRDLYIPLDIHVQRVARSLGILNRKQADWKAVEELTQNLRIFDKEDPVKYDYALFGLGIIQYDKQDKPKIFP